MAECEALSTCPFFNEKMADMPGTAASLKGQFCQGDNTTCARYMVSKALGKSNVPSDLFPNQMEKAKEIIAKG